MKMETMKAQHLQLPRMILHLWQVDLTLSPSSPSLTSVYTPAFTTALADSCFKFPFGSCTPLLQRAVLSALSRSEVFCSCFGRSFSFESPSGSECPKSRLDFSSLSLQTSELDFFSLSSGFCEFSFGDLQSREKGKPRKRTIKPLIRRAPLHVISLINLSIKGLKTSIPVWIDRSITY